MLVDPRTTERYRVVETPAIVEELTRCWGYQVAAGDHAGARRRAEAAIAELHEFGLPSHQDSGRALYDPFEVLNFLRVAGEVGASSAWDDSVAAGRRMVTELGGRQSPLPPPARFQLVLQRQFNARHFPRVPRLRLRMPGPAEPARQKAQVHVAVSAGLDWQLAPAEPGRIEVQLMAPPTEGLVSVTSTITFEASADAGLFGGRDAPPLAEHERRLYTAPREGLIVVSPALAARALALVEGAGSDLERLRRLWTFTSELQFGYPHYDAFDPRDPLSSVLGHRWANCQLGAAFLVALCRACAIPARMVAGYCLHPVDPYYHYWAEVHLPERGWIPVDLAGVSLTAHRQAPRLPPGLGAKASGPPRVMEEAWRDVFFGRLDYRFKVEIFPRVFTGNVGLRLPADWYMLTGFAQGASERRYHCLQDGALLYRDLITVQQARQGDNVPQCSPLQKGVQVES